MQDVIVSLGAPSERFKKTDSRLLIHSDNLEGNQNEGENSLFIICKDRIELMDSNFNFLPFR